MRCGSTNISPVILLWALTFFVHMHDQNVHRCLHNWRDCIFKDILGIQALKVFMHPSIHFENYICLWQNETLVFSHTAHNNARMPVSLLPEMLSLIKGTILISGPQSFKCWNKYLNYAIFQVDDTHLNNWQDSTW